MNKNIPYSQLGWRTVKLESSDVTANSQTCFANFTSKKITMSKFKFRDYYLPFLMFKTY